MHLRYAKSTWVQWIIIAHHKLENAKRNAFDQQPVWWTLSVLKVIVVNMLIGSAYEIKDFALKNQCEMRVSSQIKTQWQSCWGTHEGVPDTEELLVFLAIVQYVWSKVTDTVKGRKIADVLSRPSNMLAKPFGPKSMLMKTYKAIMKEIAADVDDKKATNVNAFVTNPSTGCPMLVPNLLPKAQIRAKKAASSARTCRHGLISMYNESL